MVQMEGRNSYGRRLRLSIDVQSISGSHQTTGGCRVADLCNKNIRVDNQTFAQNLSQAYLKFLIRKGIFKNRKNRAERSKVAAEPTETGRQLRNS